MKNEDKSKQQLLSELHDLQRQLKLSDKSSKR